MNFSVSNLINQSLDFWSSSLSAPFSPKVGDFLPETLDQGTTKSEEPQYTINQQEEEELFRILEKRYKIIEKTKTQTLALFWPDLYRHLENLITWWIPIDYAKQFYLTAKVKKNNEDQITLLNVNFSARANGNLPLPDGSGAFFKSKKNTKIDVYEKKWESVLKLIRKVADENIQKFSRYLNNSKNTSDLDPGAHGCALSQSSSSSSTKKRKEPALNDNSSKRLQHS